MRARVWALVFKMKHESFYHNIGNFQYRIKFRNFVDMNYLATVWTYKTSEVDITVNVKSIFFWKVTQYILVNECDLFDTPVASTFMIE